MQIVINGEECHVPSDVSSISLGRYIEWYEAYGRELDEELDEAVKKDYKKALIENGVENPSNEEVEEFIEMALESHIDKEAMAWYTFWTGADFESYAQSNDLIDFLVNYRIIRNLLHNSEIEAEHQPISFNWNGEDWRIQEYKITPGSGMTINEIITSKEVIRQLKKLEKSKWESMLYLAAIYLRKVDEQFKDEMIYEGSERLELMKQLPLNYAFRVAFFLKSCLSSLVSHSQYLKEDHLSTPSPN